MTINQFFRSGARWSVLLLAVSIPVSIALDNVLLAILLLCGLIGYSTDIWNSVRNHPVARASWMLFFALLLGCTYGSTALGDALVMVEKYADLAFVPLLLVLFKDDQLRRRAENGFLLMMVLTAILSWLVGLHFLSTSFCLWRGCEADNPSIFVSHIAHNLMMAFATYLLALRAMVSERKPLLWMYLGLALLTGLDVLLLVQGRTGYLVLGVLLPYFVWTSSQQWLQKRGRRLGWVEVAGMSALVVLTIWAAYQFSPRLHERVDLILTESTAWKAQGRDDTSTGLRLDFYTNSAKVIANHPWLGVGTGGFIDAYQQQVLSTNMPATRNPHNEYLHLAVQLGIMGLALFLFLLYTQWRTARLLENVRDRDAATGIVLALLVTGMFNTPLMDHTEGLFFAYMGALCFASFTRKVQHA